MTKPRHSPLAHLALANQTTESMTSAAVVLQALPYHPSLILRGEGDNQALLDSFRSAMGFNLPISSFGVIKQSEYSAFWLGPNEWLILGDRAIEKLAGGLADCHHALISVGDGQQIIAISGARAIDVLAKHCPLDLRDPKLSPPWCTRTVLAGIQIILHSLDDSSYHVHVGRSLSDYTWRILKDAALEFSVTTVSE